MTRRAQAYPGQAVDLFHAATERAQGKKVEALRASLIAYRVRLEMAYPGSQECP
jgi:hypothetical protein